jgi:hypothetical protein
MAMKTAVVLLVGARLSSLGAAVTTDLLYQPQMTDVDDCGATDGMKIGRGNESTRRKPAPASLLNHKIHMTRLGLEPGQLMWEASD